MLVYDSDAIFASAGSCLSIADELTADDQTHIASHFCHIACSVQFGHLTDWVIGGTWQRMQQRSSSSLFCRKRLWAVLASTLCPLFDVHPAFALPTTASPTLQSALNNSFWEAVVARDMPKPSEFPSLDSCQTVCTYRLYARHTSCLNAHNL